MGNPPERQKFHRHKVLRLLWRFVDGRPTINRWKSFDQVPSRTAVSDAMSKELKRRGFKFVGSTICYALMQATGMVNDHLVGCFRHAALSQPAPRRAVPGKRQSRP